MFFLKRALTSVKRTPVKSIALFLLIFILGSVVSGAISVRRAIYATEFNLRRNMRPVVMLTVDSDARYEASVLAGEYVDDVSVSLEIIYEIGQLPYVEYFDYSMWVQMESFDLDIWFPVSREGVSPWRGVGSGGADFGELFMMRGVSHSEFIDIRQGFIEVVDGRSFTATELVNGEPVAVISQYLAEQNGLMIGDIVYFENNVFDLDIYPTLKFASEDYEFEIIGLFELVGVNGFELGKYASNWTSTEARMFDMINQIYLPNAIVREADIFNNYHRNILAEQQGFGFEWESVYRTEPIFVLYDPLELEVFRTASQSLLPGFWILDDPLNRFEPMSTAMEMIQAIADSILLTAIIASFFVLGLLITLFLYDRRHEVVIYVALGEKKTKIICQIFTEVMVVATLATTISLFTGTLISERLSHQLLQNEMASIEVVQGMAFSSDSVNRLEWMGFAPPMDGEEMLKFYDFTITGITILTFYTVSLITVIFSTIIPTIYLIRLNPKKVLM
ncbi:MAG: ABC transporter permease [Turicibacter sp.]|nr:ABC transporter permease [Turicibacter sp.]